MSDRPARDSHGPGGTSVGVFGTRAAQHRSRLWLHTLLFLLTGITTTFMGAVFYGWIPAEMSSLPFLELITHPTFIREGLKFSIPLLAILTAHEAGHYVAARRHGLATTLPFFLPMPIPLPYSPGTMGAVMRIKEPIRSRIQLLDIGAAGPLAGFFVAVPVLVVGVALSQAISVPEGSLTTYFGEPILFRFVARVLFFPGLAGGEDIFLHPTGWAAWWGLFVTALNMLPLFQLDGGHVTYALFGRRHRRAARSLLAGLILLCAVWPGWALWAAIICLLGPEHPRIPDEDVPLDPLRKTVGWVALAVFVLCFTFVPIRPW